MLILGSGPIGCWQTVMARDRGARRVFLSDVNRERLDLALGVVGKFVDDAWVAGEDNGVEDALSRTEGLGPSRISVAAPSKQAQQAALEMAAKRARVVYFAGLPKHDPVSALDMNQLHYKELAILGAYGATHRQYRITMDYLNRRRDDLAPVVTHRFELDRIAEAFETIRSGDGAEDGRSPLTGPYVIGCDVGSQGTNAALYDVDGTLVASAYEAYDLSFPIPRGPSRIRRTGSARSTQRSRSC